MIVDFHTHVFPDAVAPKALSALTSKSSDLPFTDGTYNGLLKSMSNVGADISINLPVLTKPTQFDGVLDFATKINSLFVEGEYPSVISFAGFHPLCDNVKEKMHEIKKRGIKGIKIHPDFQFTFFDDEKYVEIVKRAADEDLIVVTHAGIDNGFKEYPVRCTPERVINLYEKVGYNKLVLAHLGGHKLWEEVLQKLCGLDLFFDTAFTFYGIKENTFKEIVGSHGSEKILFATDSPWSDLKSDINKLGEYITDKKDLDNITYKNALKLLSLTK